MFSIKKVGVQAYTYNADNANWYYSKVRWEQIRWGGHNLLLLINAAEFLDYLVVTHGSADGMNRALDNARRNNNGIYNIEAVSRLSYYMVFPVRDGHLWDHVDANSYPALLISRKIQNISQPVIDQSERRWRIVPTLLQNRSQYFICPYYSISGIFSRYIDMPDPVQIFASPSAADPLTIRTITIRP